MKNKNSIPEQVIFYNNFKGAIYGGTPDQVKRLMVAFCQFAFENQEPEVEPDIAMTFGMMKSAVEADRKHYADRCEQNRINALKRTGVVIFGVVSSIRYTDLSYTFTVDGEEYCFELKDDDTKYMCDCIMENMEVEIEYKGGKPVRITQAFKA